MSFMTVSPRAPQFYAVVESLKNFLFSWLIVFHRIKMFFSLCVYKLDFKIPLTPQFSGIHVLGNILPPAEILRVFNIAFSSFFFSNT